MKFPDWKARIQALFRAPQHENLKGPDIHRTTAAINGPQAVEIRIPSTGERFVHDLSLSPPGDLQRSANEDGLDFADHDEEFKRAADEALNRWDGRSVRDIATDNFFEHPQFESHPALQSTVPQQARAQFWHPSPDDPDYRSSMTVLAVDQQGEALVKRYAVDDRRDAEGWSYNVLPKDQAIDLLQEYGASADLKLDAVDSFLAGASHVHSPVIGATYRGEILSIEGGMAYQAVGEGTAIAHKISALAITNPAQYMGKDVEISYPCGHVGLVRPVDGMAHSLSERENFAEKTAAGFER